MLIEKFVDLRDGYAALDAKKSGVGGGDFGSNVGVGQDMDVFAN